MSAEIKIVDGKMTLVAEGFVGNGLANNRGLEALACPNLTTDAFNVNDNKGLKTLRGGPRQTQSYSATGCGLVSLDMAATTASMLDVSNNKSLKVLDGLPAGLMTLVAGKCGLEVLDCAGVYIRFGVRLDNNKNLKSLRGAPSSHTLSATKCGLETLDCAGTYKVVDVCGNPKLVPKGCPTTDKLHIDPERPVLFVVGKVGELDFGVRHPWNGGVSATVFRFKLELMNRGAKTAARLVDPEQPGAKRRTQNKGAAP